MRRPLSWPQRRKYAAALSSSQSNCTRTHRPHPSTALHRHLPAAFSSTAISRLQEYFQPHSGGLARRSALTSNCTFFTRVEAIFQIVLQAKDGFPSFCLVLDRYFRAHFGNWHLFLLYLAISMLFFWRHFRNNKPLQSFSKHVSQEWTLDFRFL